MSEWQTISTAPKDGTKILAACLKHGDNLYWPTTVSWRTYHPNARGKEMFRDATGIKQEHLTHWQPLPSPPID